MSKFVYEKGSLNCINNAQLAKEFKTEKFHAEAGDYRIVAEAVVRLVQEYIGLPILPRTDSALVVGADETIYLDTPVEEGFTVSFEATDAVGDPITTKRLLPKVKALKGRVRVRFGPEFQQVVVRIHYGLFESKADIDPHLQNIIKNQAGEWITNRETFLKLSEFTKSQLNLYFGLKENING